MAANARVLPDDDGAFSDWLELHNPTAASIELEGWFLTDSATEPRKWRLPAVTLPPGGFLVVFASNKHRTDPARPLHTNFALSAGGEYLGLVKPDGETVAAEFAPRFPAQTDDISYGLVTQPDGARRAGFLRRATPGTENGGPEALMLTETVSFSRPSAPFAGPFVLELTGAAPGQKIRFSAHGGIHAADAALDADSPEYTGPLTVDHTTLIRAAVFSADDRIQGPVTTAHYLKLDRSLDTFASRLPVLVIDTLGAGPLAQDDHDHPAWSYAFAGGEGTLPTFAAPPIQRTPLLATVRGNSSAEFPKLGYNLKLRDPRGQKRELPLLQLSAAERWALVAPWSFDHNYINNPFVYALSNRLGRWAPRTQLAEVFLNGDGDDLDSGDYAGIYVLTERIEVAATRLAIAGLSPRDIAPPAITGGYILKIDAPDPGEIGWRTANRIPDDTFSEVILVAPDEDDVAPEQIVYIRDYVQRMEDALFRDRAGSWAQRSYLDYLDRPSWVDHHLLNVFVSNPDAFVRSAYFHKPRHGKLHAGPVWDFDRALGGLWDYRGDTANSWSGTIEPDVDFWRSGWWGVLATDPEFRQDWIERWQSLRRSEFAPRALASLVDSLAAAVGQAAAARDAARWPDNLPANGSYAGQIAQLKAWLRQRAEWIDRQFVAAPTVIDNGSTVTFVPPAGAVLAYTLDGSDPRSRGGHLAPNALLSPAPLAVPLATNVQVRSYRADWADAFPATPWSSATGGPASTPLHPRPRIANLSARANVGSLDGALVAGITVADTDGKTYLTRAIGPALAQFGASGLVADPRLSITDAGGTELLRNQGWENSADVAQLPALARRVGAFPLPAGSADSALAATLPRGSFTLEIATPTGQEGSGLAEIYELDATGRTTNLSARARIGGSHEPLTGGFVISTPAHSRVLIRAVGPTLRQLGVTEALEDTVLTLFAGQTVVAANDRWQDASNAEAVAAATRSVGAFRLADGSEDAAVLITLPPGAYTAEVRGKSTAGGTALLEIYEVP
jgi:hypothetical protein